MTGIGATFDSPVKGAAWTPGKTAARAIRSMRRSAELVGLGILLFLYAFVYVLGLVELYTPMNIAGPVALSAILGWSAYRIVKRNPIAVWAPLFWFRVACAAYYGFGALVAHVVNEEALQRIYSLHHFDEALNLKVNLVYCFGIFCVLAFSYFILGLRQPVGRREETGIAQRPVDRTRFFAVVFLLVGGGLHYGVSLPYTFGLTAYTLPGVIGTLGKIYYVGIYLLVVHAIGRNRRVLLFAAALIVFEVIVSVASFAKMQLLLILIFSFLGFISRDVTKTKVLVGAAVLVFTYMAFQSLVHYGRAEIALSHGEIRGAGLMERLDIVQRYFAEGNNRPAAVSQGGLTRLSYVSVAAFAIERYDSGESRNTLGNAFAVLVPRLLWPDKPIITSLGPELYLYMMAREGSALGLGHFAEAYWNAGWEGIVFFMFVLAFVLSVFTRISIGIVSRKDWLYFPVVFIGVFLGLRVDGHFVPDILGPAWIAFCLGSGIWVVRRLSIKRHDRALLKVSGIS